VTKASCDRGFGYFVTDCAAHASADERIGHFRYIDAQAGLLSFLFVRRKGLS
jgi:hypothetical protein